MRVQVVIETQDPGWVETVALAGRLMRDPLAGHEVRTLEEFVALMLIAGVAIAGDPDDPAGGTLERMGRMARRTTGVAPERAPSPSGRPN